MLTDDQIKGTCFFFFLLSVIHCIQKIAQTHFIRSCLIVLC